jgi:3-dehydroquinate synthetase
MVRGLLVSNGLPVKLSRSEATVDLLMEAIGRDKTRVGASVPFVLLGAPGEVRLGCEVAPAELRAALEDLVG